MLGELITSKTRLRLLVKFFISQANKGHLNGLATEMGESTNSIRKELNHLYAAGYIEKTKVNNKVEYNVNVSHPLYETLRSVVFKHLGLEDIIETVLERMGDVEHILISGDYAKGIDSGNIERGNKEVRYGKKSYFIYPDTLKPMSELVSILKNGND